MRKGSEDVSFLLLKIGFLDEGVREGVATGVAGLGAQEVTEIGQVCKPLEDLAAGGVGTDDGGDGDCSGLVDVDAEETGLGGDGIEGGEIIQGGDAIDGHGPDLDEGGGAFVEAELIGGGVASGFEEGAAGGVDGIFYIYEAGICGGGGGKDTRGAIDIGIGDGEEVVEAVWGEGYGADAEEIEVEGFGKEGVAFGGAEGFDGVVSGFFHGMLLI